MDDTTFSDSDTPPPWTPYSVGRPSSRPNWTEKACRPLRFVNHVAHIETARQIISDGQIRARLISDESCLNKERIQVVWSSPNHWGDGFRYGNVSFQFAWPDVLNGLNAYWVEVMQYGRPAPRILLTSKDYKGKLKPYDWKGTTRKGPWWYDQASQTHYWNGEYTLEFMVEQDLPLARATKIDFVDHHRAQCALDWRTCKEKGLRGGDAAKLLVALLVSQEIAPPQGLFTRAEGARVLPLDGLETACAALWEALAAVRVSASGITLPPDARAPVARALLGALSRGTTSELSVLGSLFQSPEELFQSVEELLRTSFGLAPDTDLKWRG